MIDFYRTLSAKNNLKRYNYFTTNYWLGGNFQNQTNKCTVFYNGDTYAVGYMDNSHDNKCFVFKYSNGTLTSNQFNDGTNPSAEPLNHPTPSIYIDNSGYIYLVQNQFHVYPFRVWKSDSPEDITAFTQLSDFGTSLAYLGLIKQDNSTCWFISRKGGSGDYTQAVINVDLSNPSTYTQTQITATDWSNSVRHYPLLPHRYGTSSYYVGGIAHRIDGTIRYFKTSLWVTTDLDEFHSIDLGFSKSVSGSGTITPTELENNYRAVGTDFDRTISVSDCRLIQVDNDIFLCWVDNEETYKINKYTIGTGLVKTFTIPLSIYFDAADGGGGYNFTYMWYNGTDIVFSCGTYANICQTYTIDTDLTSINYQVTNYDERGTGYGLYIGYPWNLNDIQQGQEYMVFGRSRILSGGAADYGNVTYSISKDKYI